ncbi:MAG: hypothetical protein J7K54_04100 [Candidatus Aenigmarchaeota archaeon]|nr:hypothetical protein [Candidatus Aenigmarchaeota archaeon]
MNNLETSSAGALAAIAAALQIVHIGWASPWGMWIDAVAVSWIVAYLIYGWRTSLAVSLLSAAIITFVAPSTWLGSLTKWTASVPLILVMIAMEKSLRIQPDGFRRLRYITSAVVLAALIRAAVMIPLNYYFAIPIWTGWSSAQAMEFVPWWAIAGINAAQTAVEAALAWLLVFRFRLDRFSAWK